MEFGNSLVEVCRDDPFYGEGSTLLEDCSGPLAFESFRDLFTPNYLCHRLAEMREQGGLILMRFLTIMNSGKLADAGGFACEHHGPCRKEPPSAWRRC